MPIDTRKAFSEILNSADTLLEKASKRASAIAPKAQTKVSSVLGDVSERVEQTQLEAQTALIKLANERALKDAQRAEKVATAQHIAKVAARLLEA
jgi:ElaB/YqjD/DUF883 family membrane-anchored ribosome-binding protein